MNERLDYAVKVLRQYKKETSSHYTRSTTDLSPLEEWLMVEMYNRRARYIERFKAAVEDMSNGVLAFRQAIDFVFKEDE